MHFPNRFRKLRYLLFHPPPFLGGNAIVIPRYSSSTKA